MMGKGFYTQGVCLLTDGTTTLDEICSLLQQNGFPVLKRHPTFETWQMSGPSAVIAYRPEVNGYAQVDVVDQLWPDTMGDPSDDMATFGAWSMGHFGPHAYPGGLSRAGQHSWSWAPGKTIADTHRGFVRIRLSYAFGAADDDPLFPADYDALSELTFVMRVTRVLLEMPSVICYFNPNGEVLIDRDGFVEMLDDCQERELVPLPLWTNIRFFKIDSQLSFMDNVGNSQLDLFDLEALFRCDQYDPGAIDGYLRNVTLYLMEGDRKLETGEHIDGPNETNLTWRIDVFEDHGLSDPPRGVIRLSPKSLQKQITNALKSAGLQ